MTNFNESLPDMTLQAELLQVARRIRAAPQREAPIGEAAVRGEGSGRESTMTPEPPPPRRSVNTAPQLPPRKKLENRKSAGDHWEM